MINVFARPSYIGNRWHRWSDVTQTQRLSSRVRAEEMAEWMPGEIRVNPWAEEIGENDINIYVKPENVDMVGHGDWLDYLDGGHFDDFGQLKKRPDINLIAVSENSFDTLKKDYPNNKIVLIPHHHINFKMLQRTKTTIDTCGYIGSYSPGAEKVYRRIKYALAEIGIVFIVKFDYKSREDAVDFYKNIDLLIVGGWEWGDPKPHKIPTKLINAFSFGIPAIAYPLGGYKEIEGLYYPVHNMAELIDAVTKFKDQLYYDSWATKAFTFSQKYHIDQIAKLYRQLK
jgi:hypothetical protein